MYCVFLLYILKDRNIDSANQYSNSDSNSQSKYRILLHSIDLLVFASQIGEYIVYYIPKSAQISTVNLC